MAQLAEVEVVEGFDVCRKLRTLIVAALSVDLPRGLYPYQVRVSDKVILATLKAAGIEVIINQCRQSGKTEAIIISVLVLSVYYAKILGVHLRVGVFAPAGSQATQIVKERLKLRYTRIKPLLKQFGLQLVTGDSFYSELFVIRNAKDGVDARVRCLSIGERSNVTGETFHLLIIEQAEDVDPLKMAQEVFPMSAAIGGARILSGTPKNVVANTYFYDACTKRLDPEDREQIIEVAWEEAAKYNAKYKAFVIGEREKLGPRSIAFRTQYGLEWALGVDKFTNLDQMRALSRKSPYFVATLDGKPLASTHAGWDVAKENDRSVATWGIIEGTLAHIIEWMEFEGTDYREQAERIAIRCVELNTKQICVDSAGVGDPVIDFLKAELRKIPGGLKCSVKGIATNSIKEEDITSKLMDDTWRVDEFDYPSIEEARAKHLRRERARFIEEFLDLNKIWKGGMMRVEHSKGYDRHDDYPKSCGLMLRSMLKPPLKLVVRELAW